MKKGAIALPWLLFGFLLIIFLVTNSTKTADDKEAIVTYDGGEISKQTLYDSMFQLVGAEEIEFLIFEKVIELASTKQGVKVTSEEVNDELDVLRKQAPSPEEFEMMLIQNGISEQDLMGQIETQLILRKIFKDDFDVTEEELKKEFEEQKEFYREGERVQASHILVDSEKEAENILKRLKEGEDFAEMAKEHSKDSSQEFGGELGFFEKGMMAPAFEEEAFALEVGEMSHVVETEFGFHIILVTDKVEEVIPSFEKVKDRFYNDFMDSKISAQLPEWIEQQKATYGFEVK